MAGQDRGHFPRKEQPDVGRAYGDVPRAFDARFLHEDDAVVRLGKAEQKPRPRGDAPCDDEKAPPSRPPRRMLDDSLADPPAHEPSPEPAAGHDSCRRAPPHRGPQHRHASRPGMGALLEHLRDHDPPQAVPDEVHALPFRRLDERPEGLRRLREISPPGAVPEVAHAETRLLETTAEDVHLRSRHPKAVYEHDRFDPLRFRRIPPHASLPAGIISQRLMVDWDGERTCDPPGLGGGRPCPAGGPCGRGSPAPSRRPLVPAPTGQLRPRRDRQTSPPGNPPLYPYETTGSHRSFDVRPEGARGGRGPGARARNPERCPDGGD